MRDLASVMGMARSEASPSTWSRAFMSTALGAFAFPWIAAAAAAAAGPRPPLRNSPTPRTAAAGLLSAPGGGTRVANSSETSCIIRTSGEASCRTASILAAAAPLRRSAAKALPGVASNAASTRMRVSRRTGSGGGDAGGGA
ncbi:hypothetical protein Vretifemale_232 [Volvox reticuliferus]|uniref:Uncharacterized protein n=1 Tax=Volvox reticuliferus TaxID=1737510 RepID=A0A8J4FBF9_9CHLO|nr:hypothetical protein Vretifemale_232 [Volvox reticuliferus]